MSSTPPDTRRRRSLTKLVAAGAVVTKDVPDFALVVGVPARRVGWVGRAGRPLVAKDGNLWVCPETSAEYVEADGTLTER